LHQATAIVIGVSAQALLVTDTILENAENHPILSWIAVSSHCSN
jgi:multisubunit Na+/H+ antiporter MnhC subunit